jgi:hypothetical protein
MKAIKVGELIEKLQELDSGKRVYLADWGEQWADDLPLIWDDITEDGNRIILGAG